MTDIYASHHPRSKSEKRDVRPRIDGVLDDWGDENWLQFSMWDLHQIRAYLLRMLAGDQDGAA